MKELTLTAIISVFLSTIITSLILHFFIQRREKIKIKIDNLTKISNLLLELRQLYNEHFNLCFEYNYNEAYLVKKNILKIYHEVYNLAYFSFEEFIEILSNDMSIIINTLEENENNSKGRQNKDNYNVNRNMSDEIIYEDQSHYNIPNYFNQFFQLIKCKMETPLKKLNQNRLDKIVLYNPSNIKDNIIKTT